MRKRKRLLPGEVFEIHDMRNENYLKALDKAKTIKEMDAILDRAFADTSKLIDLAGDAIAKL